MTFGKVASSMALVLLSMVAAPVARAAEPWEGRWAMSEEALENCGAYALDTDNGIVDLSSTGYEAYASACSFKRIQKTSQGWRAAASCADEGEDGTYKATVRIVMSNRDRMKLHVDQMEWELVRCARITGGKPQ